MKVFLSVFVLFLITVSAKQESTIEGLSVEFRKLSEDTIIADTRSITIGGYSGSGMPVQQVSIIEAPVGMKYIRLKVTFKNNGNKNCLFKLTEIYLSTEQDSLYQLTTFDGVLNPNQTKIKPTKEIKRTLYFEFPKNATPKELFIEDKRFKVVISTDKGKQKNKNSNMEDYEDKD